MTGNALFAACLATPADRTAWNALADFVMENISNTPVRVESGSVSLVAKRFVGDAVLLVSVNGAGGSVPVKKLAVCLKRFATRK